MNTSAVIAVVLANLLVWVGGFFFVRYLMRRARQRFSEFPPVSPPVASEGFTVEFWSCHVASGPSDRPTRIPWTEYTVRLRGALAEAGLIDADAQRVRREEVVPALEFSIVGPVETGDSAFDGQFYFTQEPTAQVAAALAEPRVRELLLQLRDAYKGLFIEDGVVRVAEAGRPDAEARETNVEALVGVALQLEALAPEA